MSKAPANEQVENGTTLGPSTILMDRQTAIGHIQTLGKGKYRIPEIIALKSSDDQPMYKEKLCNLKEEEAGCEKEVEHYREEKRNKGREIIYGRMDENRNWLKYHTHTEDIIEGYLQLRASLHSAIWVLEYGADKDLETLKTIWEHKSYDPQMQNKLESLEVGLGQKMQTGLTSLKTGSGKISKGHFETIRRKSSEILSKFKPGRQSKRGRDGGSHAGH